MWHRPAPTAPETAPETEEVVEETPATEAPEAEESVKTEDNKVAEETVTDKEDEAFDALKKANEKIAIYSSKNLHWLKVGQLKPGYNIVTKEASEKWLTRKQVRIATPEELASYYGK